MKILEKLNQLKNVSENYFGFSSECFIKTNLQGLSAGKADIVNKIIRLNKDFLYHYPDKMIDEVLPHEYAHILAYEVDRKKGVRNMPHGGTWQSIMRLFGLEPKRTHDFDITKTKVRKIKYFLYSCGCRDHCLSSIRHNRLKRYSGKLFYSCSICGERLKYIKPLRIGNE